MQNGSRRRSVNIQMYKTLLFDFDGTLSPTLAYWLGGYEYALKKLGVDADEGKIIQECFYKSEHQIAAAFALESCDTFWQLVAEGMAARYATPALFPGVKDVLDYCTRKKIPVGLVTSAERGLIDPALHSLGINHHFDVTVTADDITHFKPHPEPVLKALHALGATPAETLFVGDYLVDVAAGKAAGTDTAVFFTDDHSKFHKLEELQSAEPTFIFSDYVDLLAKLEAHH